MATGLSLRQALARNAVTWGLLVAGFLVVYFLIPTLPQAVLGASLAFGAGGFVYLAYASWHEHEWSLAPSIAVAALAAAAMGGLRLLT